MGDRRPAHRSRRAVRRRRPVPGRRQCLVALANARVVRFGRTRDTRIADHGLVCVCRRRGRSGKRRAEVPTVHATVAPSGAPGKKTAIFSIQGFSGTFNGGFQAATGTVIGPDGEDLSDRLVFAPVWGFRDVPGGIVTWTFPGDEIYNGASGTAEIAISPASADPDLARTGGDRCRNGSVSTRS